MARRGSNLSPVGKLISSAFMLGFVVMIFLFVRFHFGMDGVTIFVSLILSAPLLCVAGYQIVTAISSLRRYAWRNKERKLERLAELSKSPLYHVEQMDGQAFGEFINEALERAGCTVKSIEVISKKASVLVLNHEYRRVVILAKRLRAKGDVDKDLVKAAIEQQKERFGECAWLIVSCKDVESSASKYAQKRGVVIYNRDDLQKLVTQSLLKDMPTFED